MRVYKFLTAHFALKSLYEKRLKVSTLDDLNDPFELIPYELSDQKHRIAMRNAKETMANKYGVLCFSAAWSDPVIWAHYADKHRGICLGFEVEDNKCMTVKYVDHRLPFPRTGPTLEESLSMLDTKFTNWKYEQEIRSWLTLKESEDGQYFCDFSDNMKLAEVIAGARCTVPKTAFDRALGPLAQTIEPIKACADFERFEIVKNEAGFIEPETFAPK